MRDASSVVIREMRPGEEKALLAAARKAFVHSPLEQLALAKPESALVAEVDGAVAGAMFLRVYGTGENKTGYLDVGFVVKEFRGRGVGGVLYPAATEHLRALGCGLVTAQVLDDNVASWKTLQNHGFGAPSLTGLVRTLGLLPAASLWLRTLFCVACGAQFWMDRPVKDRGSFQELASFLGVNLLLFLPRLAWYAAQPGQFAHRLSAYLFVLLMGILFGGAGCLAAGGRWRISFPRGGLLLTLFLTCFGVVFPMAARWQPQSPPAGKEYRRTLGLQAAVEWVGMMILFSLGAFLLKDNDFLHLCATFTASLLVYRALPFMPFGGGRVWNWNKIVFAALALATAAMILLVF